MESLGTACLTVTAVETVYRVNSAFVNKVQYFAGSGCHKLLFKYTGSSVYTMTGGRELHTKPGSLLYFPETAEYKVSPIEYGECVVVLFRTLETAGVREDVFSFENSELIGGLFLQLEQEWLQNMSDSRRYRVKSTLYAILAAVGNNFTAAYLPGEKRARIEKAMKLLSERYTDKELRIEELARAADISPVYFRRLFTELYGIPPLQYIRKLKINRSRDLIASGYYSISEVAEQLGYSDAAYFSRCFKREFGVPPGRYAVGSHSR